jgi:hypothetical protein
MCGAHPMSEWGVYCMLFHVSVPRVRVRARVTISDTYWHRKQPALLRCTVLHCPVLYCTVLYCFVLYFSAYHWGSEEDF